MKHLEQIDVDDALNASDSTCPPETEAQKRLKLQKALDEQKEQEGSKRRKVEVVWLNDLIECPSSMSGYLPTVKLTLTLKPSIADEVLDQFDRLVPEGLSATERKRLALLAPNRIRARTFINRAIATKELNKWLRRVSRNVGGTYRRGKAWLGCSFSIEGGTDDKKLHIHGWIEIPQGMTSARFIRILRETWLQSIWALPIAETEQTRNQVATTKYHVKGGIENVDVFNTRRSTTRIG